MGPTPIVRIELDKPRTLRLDLNGMYRLKEKTGEDALDPEFWKAMDLPTVHKALWGALLHEDPDLTLENVGGMIYLGNFKYVREKVLEALGLAMPPPDGSEGDAKNA